MQLTKRYVSVLLVIVMLTAYIGVYAADGELIKSVSINGIMNEDSIVLDFENDLADDTFGFTMMGAGVGGTVKEEKDGNKVLNMGTGKYVVHTEPISTGKYLLSYEMHQPNPSTALLKLLTKPLENIHQQDAAREYEMHIIGEKEFGYYVNQNGNGIYNQKKWTVAERKSLERNMRHRVDVYFDFDKNEVYHYIDNVLWVKEALSARLGEICGFYFYVEKNVLEMDNVIFTRVDRNITRKMEELGVAYPDGWRGNLDMLLLEDKENAFAFNYFESSPKLKLRVLNDAEAGTYSMNYKLMDSNGLVKWEKSDTLTLAAGETIEHPVKVQSAPYGVLTLIVTAENKKTGDITEYRKHIALLNGPKDGKTNPTLGAGLGYRDVGTENNHDILKMAKKAGFSSLRYSIRNNDRPQWVIGEDIPLRKVESNFLDSVRELGFFVNFETAGGFISAHDMPRESRPGSLEQWKFYCEELARVTHDLPGGVSYEIWNEPNMEGAYFNPYGTRQDYAKLIAVAEEGLKKYISDPFVIGGATSGTGDSYIADILKYGGNETMDAASCHPYTWMQGPEAGQMFPKVQGLRNVLTDTGFAEEKPIWLTEIGWYLHVGVDEAAIYTLQMFLLNHIYGDLAEKILVFELIDTDNVPRETFGLFNGVVDYDQYLARPAAVALANYANLLTDSVYEGEFEYGNNVPLYRFKLADGRDMITFWTQKGGAQISLDMGTDEVELIDIYGNSERITGIDGKFQFDASIYPQYVVGNFSKLEKCPDLFRVSKDKLEVVNYDKAEISVDNMTGKTLELSTTASENVVAPEGGLIGSATKRLVYSAEDISKSTAKKTVEGGGVMRSDAISEIVDENVESVSLEITGNGKTYYKKTLRVECVPALSVEHYIKNRQGDDWEYVIEAKNNKFNDAVDGVVRISGPASFSKYIPEWSIGKIAAGQNKKIKIPIPDLMDRKETAFEGELVLNDGITIDVSQELSFRGIPKIRIAPKIDGVLSEDEWPQKYKLQMNDTSGKVVPIGNGSWNGTADSSAEIYVCFDDENLYFAAEVTDDVQAEDPLRRLWSCDSFQFNVALEKTQSASYTELGLGLLDGVPTVTRDSGLIAMGLGVAFPHELQIVRDDASKKTIYEFSVPFTEIYTPDFDVRDYSALHISVLLNDRDSTEAEDRDSYFEYGSGIGAYKDPSLYYTYSLIK